jgi:hypothetical protein
MTDGEADRFEPDKNEDYASNLHSPSWIGRIHGMASSFFGRVGRSVLQIFWPAHFMPDLGAAGKSRPSPAVHGEQKAHPIQKGLFRDQFPAQLKGLPHELFVGSDLAGIPAFPIMVDTIIRASAR